MVSSYSSTTSYFVVVIIEVSTVLFYTLKLTAKMDWSTGVVSSRMIYWLLLVAKNKFEWGYIELFSMI